MTDLVVRRLLVDLEAPFEPLWCGGDAFRTAFFDALSMSFPVGEQFFIDSVRAGVKALPDAAQARFRAEVQGFVGQEATHRRLHALFNAQLESQGLVNRWAGRATKRIERLAGLDPRHAVAITAAFEHFTAIFADWTLANPDVLDGSEDRLATLWSWHAAEECEHKSTAFDVYAALGGSVAWRRTWFRRVTFFFVTDVLRQTVSNLHRQRTLWRRSTWRRAASDLFGRRGLVRQTIRPWRDYLADDFHPSQHDSARSLRWLDEHRDRFVPVGAV